MSVSGIMSTSFFQPSQVQNSFQQRRAEFQQLGQALQSGNLSAAQQDFAELTSSGSSASTSGATTATTTTAATGTGSAASTSPVSSIGQEFTALGQALQAGNLSAAQQAYSAMQQIGQTQGHHHHHHHHHHAM